MATYSMRRNFIGSLTHDDGSIITDHEQKGGALWLAYKDRFYMNFLNLFRWLTHHLWMILSL
jgi:hypothetical protein